MTAVSLTPDARPTDQPRQRAPSGRVRSQMMSAASTRLTCPCHRVP
ncbi:Uncharacterised protein [Mycobacteroides abscessus subsp. abscessus]|nr:Uncharacterised protein [Mycobacteroides abscessus subsp. abscessus]